MNILLSLFNFLIVDWMNYYFYTLLFFFYKILAFITPSLFQQLSFTQNSYFLTINQR